jgi:hypothetical protein
MLVVCRQNWGDERVYYQDESGALCSIPRAWTSLAPADPSVHLATERSAFRVADLLELARLLTFLSGEQTQPEGSTNGDWIRTGSERNGSSK